MSYLLNINSTIKVFLVDQHKMMLFGLERLFDDYFPRMQVIGKASYKTELFTALTTFKSKAEQPDVILLDIDLNGESSLDFLEELLKTSQAKILILTGIQDTLIHQRAIIKGASGVVLKSEEPNVVIRAIQYVYLGEIWFDRGSTSSLLKSLVAPIKADVEQFDKLSSLTEKERQVVVAMATTPGFKNKMVANKLCLSEHTLRNHLSKIYSKLNLSNRVELYMFAMESKLLEHKSAA